MSGNLKSILLRGLRVIVFSAAAGIVTFLTVHLQEMFVLFGIPIPWIAVIGPIVAGALAAADKAVRLALEVSK